MNYRNDWGIPEKVVAWFFARDMPHCVYCRQTVQTHDRRAADGAQIEHFDNDEEHNPANFGVACGSCNSSKGTMSLIDWLQTDYCRQHNPPITAATVAEPVKAYLELTGGRGTMNWDDPEARAALIERVGIEGYNQLFEQHRRTEAGGYWVA